MSAKQIPGIVSHRLKKVVDGVRTRSKKVPRNGPPEWLGVGVSKDGKKRVYYFKVLFPRPVLLLYLRLRKFYLKHRLLSRTAALLLAALILVTVLINAYEPRQVQVQYSLDGAVERLLSTPRPAYAEMLKFDQKSQKYIYNDGYTPGSNFTGDSSGPKITATFGSGDDKAVVVTDPVNNVSLTLKPKFGLKAPQQNQNRLVYTVNDQLTNVFTLGANGIKEDILVRDYPGKEVKFKYEVALSNGLEMRVEKNGALGVYGVASSLLGNVSTATEDDAKLLDKARQNSEKNQILFTIPAPYVIDANKKVLPIKAEYVYKNKELTVQVSGFKDDGNYPLSIDPSIYVETAAKLMRGNNETNVDFDVTSELIQKSQTTGARINSWTSGLALPNAVFDNATTAAGGYVYSVGGQQVTTTSYTTAGTNTFTVPTGVTSVTVKAWGAGGGGGGGSGSTGVGGNGGGGGFTSAEITTTPAEGLTVEVGTAGAKAAANSAAGNGGGYSAVKRSATYLVQAGGGGGGGGARGTTNGGTSNGGAGGGASGVAGSTPTSGGGGGGGGTGSGGGAGAAGGTGAAGIAGAANAGGNAPATVTSCATATSGTGGAGGVGAGGSGGTFVTTCADGGGGGSGRFGGGGGGSVGTNNRGGGGGGGGSDLVTGTTIAETAGSGTTPGNDTDTNRGTGGNGGTGATTAASATAGNPGTVVISYYSTVATVNWAHFNSSSGAIEATNPGAGACANWCTNSAYDLPSARRGFSLVAYSGYLYAIGGLDSSGTRATTVYIAKLGANGEPSLWHPTGGSAVYWYSDTALSSARSFLSAVAYNNRMYVFGGSTSGSPGGITTVEKADINPNGVLVGSTTTGMQALPSARFGESVQAYNDVLYLMGGNSSGTLQSSTYYSKLNSDGTMNAWTLTSSFATAGARATQGGNFTTIYGAYIYMAGGCTVVNGSNYCTTVANDIWLASINADGTIGPWNQILGLTNQRIGYSLISWQNSLYRLGGCTSQIATTGNCDPASLLSTVDYGNINQDGDASTVATSVSSGVAPCSGGSPYSCSLPSASIGNVLNEAAIMNGYLYIMGGCTNDACTNVSTGVTYQAIASDGTLQKPATCTGSYTDSYCVSSADLPVALAAGATAVFNGRIYIVGGFNTDTKIYYVAINNDGSVGTWQNADLTTMGAEDVTYAFAYARANPASAGSNPGNLYIFGGCTDGTVGCSNYTDSVYKCNINTTGVPGTCSKTNQLQIGTIPVQPGGTPSGPGLGAMAGAVYANYIYLIGGLVPGVTDLTTVRYAKFDNSNNVVTVGSGWVEGSNKTVTGRRRGAGFGYNGYLYVVGGYDGTSGVLADIEFAKINVSNGSWDAFVVSAVTINQRWGLTVPVSNSYAYVIGGCTAGAAPGSCSTRTNTIQTFQIYNNDSGAMASFTSASDDTFATNTDRWGASAAILNGYLYVAGGCISATDCTNATSDVQYAPISTTDGSVGTWVNSTNNLPPGDTGINGRAWGKLVAVGGTLYYIGGQEDTATNEQSTVYYVSTFTTGNITAAWSTASGALGDVATAGVQTAPRTKFGVAVWDSRIYVIGGLDGSAAVSSTVYISPRLAAGGNIAADSWTSSTAFNVARFGAATTAYANNLYLFGGNDGTNYLNDGQFASLGYKTGTIGQSSSTVTGSGTTFTAAMVGSTLQYSDGSTATITAYSSATSITVNVSKTVTAGAIYVILDGSVGSWTYTTSTPGYISQGEAFAANGYMYIIGGRSASTTCVPNTLVAPISANTTIATSNNPTGVGEWYETNVRYTGDRYGPAVAYSGGKLYLMGGGCTAPLASTRHYYGVVKSQPQVAKYSRMMDTDTDVFPTSWLVNGIDNSVGARWQAKYRTMHDINDGAGQQNPNEDCGTSAVMAVMTTWGQETNYGDVSMGDVATYTPKESGGGNINCARYYYFSLSIDASQTFGYPEDVTRGPTIADLSLFFTADPSKRLRHGKTFTGGEQQPLDTPCRQSVDAQCPLP